MFKFLNQNLKQIIDNKSKSYSSIYICIIFLCFLNLLYPVNALGIDITDNTCTFKVDGNLFSLVYLNLASSQNYYTTPGATGQTIYFNFC
jgi:hypothetical protein